MFHKAEFIQKCQTSNYTNHSICTTRLDIDRFERRHTIQLSRCKSEATIKEYSTNYLITNKMKCLIHSLRPFCPQNKCQHKEVTERVSKSQTQKTNDFTVHDINNFDTIDDTIVANLVYSNSLVNDTYNMTKNNTNNNNAFPLLVSKPTHTNNTQVNTIDNQHFSHLPQM